MEPLNKTGQARNNNGTFRWNDVKDKLLLIEVRFLEPYLNRVGSKEAGQKWTEVAEHLNLQDGFKENPRDQRSVRERFHKLVNDFNAKTRSEEAASGIAVDPPTEIETLMEEIVEIMKSASLDQASTSKKSESKDREKALNLRDKAMKTWGRTTKKDADQSDSDNSDEKSETTPRRKRQRRRGSDALKYLKENARHEAELKKEELAFRKDQAELENKRLQVEQKRQEQLQEQAQQQMQQMQQQAVIQNKQFSMLQQQMQQQMQMQTTSQTVMMAMLERLTKQ